MQRSTMGIMLTLALGLLWTPLVATAQPAGHVWRMGVLDNGAPLSAADPQRFFFWQAMHELGWMEGQNITVERRYAEGHNERLRGLATELVQLAPDVIWLHTTIAALVAKRTITTIPVVIGASTDLEELGIVASLARPGGNLTGMDLRQLEVMQKQLELFKEAVPTIAHVAVLVTPAVPTISTTNRIPSNMAQEAQALGLQLQRIEAGAPEAFETAFA